MRVFHRTSPVSARAIVAEGFRDVEGTYMTDRFWRGVWVSDVSLDTTTVAPLLLN
jgi:hypothetical protein